MLRSFDFVNVMIYSSYADEVLSSPRTRSGSGVPPLGCVALHANGSAAIAANPRALRIIAEVYAGAEPRGACNLGRRDRVGRGVRWAQARLHAGERVS